ncbi:hypothetical protein DL96DRAFT_1670417 [Flagelloscypha sp. PMI_526]|nr:hypothetical protein DL96DRAFT_1670417 [Flagelloscypha sp. PMI_526]
MPKSKRSKLVSLTKVDKKTKEHKSKLIEDIQTNLGKWDYCWLFDVPLMRNTHLKTVRSLWKDDGRIFFGKSSVMAKALGTTGVEEFLPGLSGMGSAIHGQVGLLLTSTKPPEVLEWFKTFSLPDFPRSPAPSPITLTLEPGPVTQRHSDPPEPFPHSSEPELRKLGLNTKLVRGVPTLESSQTVCKKGEALTSEQAQLIKLIGLKCVEFKVVLQGRWEKESAKCVWQGGSKPKKSKDTKAVSEDSD